MKKYTSMLYLYLLFSLLPLYAQPRRVVPFPHIREADLMWARRVWRIIDLREKLNQPLYYPLAPSNQRKNLITILQEALLTERRIKAYDPYSGEDFKIEMTLPEIKSIGTGIDTIQVADPFPPYDTHDTVIIRAFDPSTVKQYRIKEDWYFDHKLSEMKPRILGICPRIAVYDPNTGEFRGYQDMYWLYFPDIRMVLVNAAVYNPYNFGPKITYDDVFIQRLFSSLIYKVDNSYDRRIDDYVKGLDALLEAENIKDMIFRFEHDVWEQ